MISIKPNVLYVRDQNTKKFIPLLAIKGAQGDQGPPGTSDLGEVNSELETITNALKLLYGGGTLGLEYQLDGETYTVTSVGDAKNNTEIIIPPSISGIPVTKIKKSAFVNCSNLTSVTLPESIEEIGSNAFNHCYKLVEVINKSTLNDIEKGEDSYGYIARYALEIHAEDSKIVTQGDYQFYAYDGVNYLVNYTGDDTEITLPENNSDYSDYVINKYMFRDSKVTSVTIPDSVTEIFKEAFYSCDSLTSVKIGNSVKRIGSSAFSGCYNLTSVTIGNSVTHIGDYAFDGCENLTSITIPKSITNIGNTAFLDCNKITNIYYQGTQTEWDAINIHESNESFINAVTIHYESPLPEV